MVWLKNIVHVAAAGDFPGRRLQKYAFGKVNEYLCTVIIGASEHFRRFEVRKERAGDRRRKIFYNISPWVTPSDADAGGEWKCVAVIMNVHANSYPKLTEIVQTLRNFGFLFGSGQGRQEHARENADNRDDYEQLGQGESAMTED